MALAFVGVLITGCGSGNESQRVTIAQIEALESFESLIPMTSDSVVELYRKADPKLFRETYSSLLEGAGRLVDSLNRLVKPASRIDTLALDHSFENFGNAACTGRTICLSSSYFFLYNDLSVIRSVILHEFGHIIYRELSPLQQQELEHLWDRLGDAALLYLYRDGEYSGNAKFGGHPYDSPTEFFASAFNLLNSRESEFVSRLHYVDAKHFPLLDDVKRTVSALSRTR